ncbi:MAG: 2-isopropylmalate synthase, partial [Gammaproteobacteria bacterium]|nr:2-isopropylmalate synthase [Gammaproteobacteria bacterium]
KKHEIFDDDLQALASETTSANKHKDIILVSLKVCSETGEAPMAKVVLKVNGEEISADDTGSGPIDAAFKAIEKIVKSEADLKLYSVNNITSGTDALGDVTVHLEHLDRVVNGQGADTDIVVASAKSYVNALNKLAKADDRAHPQL